MPRILLGVTGSVAAIKTPDLYAALVGQGWEVKVVATDAALYFFDPAAINPLDPLVSVRNPETMIIDSDEWPDSDNGNRYRRGDPVLHIELRRWADVLVIAPLDANTLAKLANGLSDNCLTCVMRAWDLARPVVLAPAMNTLMWRHPLTRRHLRSVGMIFGTRQLPDDLDEGTLIEKINEQCSTLRIVPPISKELACGDVGEGAMAELNQIIESVRAMIVPGSQAG